jgi:hypothetical protein
MNIMSKVIDDYKLEELSLSWKKIQKEIGLM